MSRFLARLAILLALAAPALTPMTAQAEPADIDAAARGVVRVVIIGDNNGELFPISHGTGFAVSGDTVVTNAHVVRDALRDEGMQIGIVPNGGGEAVYGRIVAVLARNDLALIRITGSLRLPPPVRHHPAHCPDRAWQFGRPAARPLRSGRRRQQFRRGQ